MIISHMRSVAKLYKTKVDWRRRNGHNQTNAVNAFDTNLVTVGRATYGALRVVAAGKSGKLCIGNWCSIASDVTFVMNNEHGLGTVSTYPFKVKVLGQQEPEALSKGGGNRR